MASNITRNGGATSYDWTAVGGFDLHQLDSWPTVKRGPVVEPWYVTPTRVIPTGIGTTSLHLSGFRLIDHTGGLPDLEE